MTNTLLQKRIMRRVCWTCYLRRLINPIMIKVYVLLAMAVTIVSVVSISNVIANIANITNLGGLYSFFVVAFFSTEVLVQSLIVGGVVFALWLLKDILKTRIHFA